VRCASKARFPAVPRQRRFALPPYTPESGLRLACQVNVLGDVTVTNHAGLFGQRTEAPKFEP
jgi:hypothetical protein